MAFEISCLRTPGIALRLSPCRRLALAINMCAPFQPLEGLDAAPKTNCRCAQYFLRDATKQACPIFGQFLSRQCNKHAASQMFLSHGTLVTCGAVCARCRYPPNEPCEPSGRCRVDGQRCSIRRCLFISQSIHQSLESFARQSCVWRHEASTRE
jgi:hypothetical protein